MDSIHYSRCVMVPTGSSLAFHLGLTPTEPRLRLELGDFEHKDDRLWLRHAGFTKHIWARSRGADTRVLAFSRHVGSQPIYVPASSEIKSPADLIGRRMAMIRNPTAEFDVDRTVFLKPYFAALDSVGATLADVTFVDTDARRPAVFNVPPQGENFFQKVAGLFLRQLAEGEVDAIATPLPPDTVRAADLRKIYDTRDDPEPRRRLELRAIVASTALIAEERPLVRRLLRSIVEAGEWAQREPGAALALFGVDLSVKTETLQARGIDPRALSRLEIDEELISIASAKQDFLLAAGMLERPIDIGSWIDPSLLREAEVAGG